ncbi:MAG TPA: dihydroorotate dehydrogenase electron transfer subunit [Clostridia bacterium]|nr:dihydroorotate dehydrogenase electron transfer subunit [Clostridia bacterium]
MGRDMVRLVLDAPETFEQLVQPGMFVHIKVPNDASHILRRPISIMDADAGAGSITLGIQPKGDGTKLICALEPDDTLEIIAPLGNSFTLNGAKTVWALGGGVGVAPMLFACHTFSKAAKVTAVLGFRTAEQIYAEGDFTPFADLMICTDDGCRGFNGTVVDAVKEKLELPELIIACGPTPMLKAVQAFALERNIPCQLSLEQRMGCGYGACLTCSCKTKKADGGETFGRVCADGPVFDAKAVVL